MIKNMCKILIFLMALSECQITVYGSDTIKLSKDVAKYKESMLKSEKYDSLHTFINFLQLEVKSCVGRKQESIWSCVKRSSLFILDKLNAIPVFPIWTGIKFVQCSVVDKWIGKQTCVKDFQYSDSRNKTWFDHMAAKLKQIFNSHVLQINLGKLTNTYTNNFEAGITNKSDYVGTARYRRHRYNMIITMIFGVTALGAVLVPMGFQLLSVVSGKALLLAKMALLLASINGLKRVANSGIHYGLYHVPGEHFGGYYDRGDMYHPRNVKNIATAQRVEEFGIQK
ncbi:uncharacterized protein LOC119683851 [Teleopsis dalmanni]|uniref:uncharacterized protein LOC119683851 n=1 Tax=Teleopsis dalmanni TaxID=139649 RepID=UPI0018CCBAE2|nr:uncharacterized protein LOC119683851 [Teleopsis dalmanni]